MDRLLDYDYHVAVAQRGVYLGYDHIGKAKYYPDNVRAALVLRLIKAGYGNQIVFSSDLARKSYFPGYGPDGKPGFGHVLTQFVPRLRALGLDDAAIITILIANPARALTLAT
jgi:phosphotriesterase-related protein